MHFLDKSHLHWTVFILCLIPKVIAESLNDGFEKFSGTSGTKFEHLVVDKDRGWVFIGAINRLYHLSPDLKLIKKFPTGPKDNPRCAKRNCPVIDNYNKILVLDYNHSQLLSCGSYSQGLCEIYAIEYPLRKIKTLNEPMIASSPNASTVAFIAPDTFEPVNPQKENLFPVLYVGTTHVHQSNIPAVATRSLDEKKFLQIAKSGSTEISINDNFREKYIVNYVYGFSSGLYSYFLTTQMNSTQLSPYISKLIRICQQDEHYYSYTEIPIECTDKFGKVYKSVQAAFIAKPSSELAKSLSITSQNDVLFGIFSQSEQSLDNELNKSKNESALCIYSLKAINDKFTENIKNCYNGFGDRGLEHILSPLEKNCHKANIGESNFCGEMSNLPFGGKLPVQTTALITFDTLSTAIAAVSISDFTFVIIGTHTGHLKQVVVKNTTAVWECNEVVIDVGSPVNPDLQFDSKKEHLYAMTKNKLTKIKVYDLLSSISNFIPNNGPWKGGTIKVDSENSINILGSSRITVGPVMYLLYIGISSVIIILIFVFVTSCIIYRRKKSKNSPKLINLQQNMNNTGEKTVALQQWVKQLVIEKDIDLNEKSSNILKLPNITIVYTPVPRDTEETSPESDYLVPIDDKWEFARSKLTVGKQLGEGEFGKVFQGEALGILYDNVTTTIAVKKLKDTHSDTHMIALASEMEMMKLIGIHENVLRLLGCCTQVGDFLIITEYALHGNLRDFLRKYISATNDEIIPTSLSEKNLLTFAVQIANGMEYLASIKCIHRDLAARNVLVSEDFVMKIGDFGLARDIHQTEYYRKKSDGRLPIKWMAPEALCHKIYTTQSDIWSYGILLWEIITLGGAPYPSFPDVGKLYQALQSGYRMEKPLNCSHSIYNLMRQCWSFLPVTRPSFSVIVQDLNEIISVSNDETFETCNLFRPDIQESDT